MKRKNIVIIAAAVVIAGAIAIYMLRPLSPSETTRISHHGLDVSVSYSRPYKKGRLIFGDEVKGALVPNGKYWRLGANDATEITFSSDVKFAGSPLKAGTYSMYAVPGEKSWQIVLNGGLNKSGAPLPDHSLDLLTVEVVTTDTGNEREQFIIELKEDGQNILMNFEWDRKIVSVPISS